MLTDAGRRLLARWIYLPIKVGDAFVVPYTPERLAAVEADASYGPQFAPFLRRCLEALQEPGWAAGSYHPGGWYRMLQGRAEDPRAVAITSQTFAPFFLEEAGVDRSGRWYVGRKTITGKVLTHFLRHLDYDGELERYVIRYRLAKHFETRYLHHEAPPIRVQRVTQGADGLRLRLNTGREEPLRPETLRLDEAEQLYCAVGAQGLPAWFEEPARWELLKDAEERDGTWVLSVGGRELTATLDAAWSFADHLPH